MRYDAGHPDPALHLPSGLSVGDPEELGDFYADLALKLVAPGPTPSVTDRIAAQHLTH